MPHIHTQHRRSRIGADMARVLRNQQQHNDEAAARNDALNRVTVQADANARESFWNRIEIVVAVLILSSIELLRTGGWL